MSQDNRVDRLDQIHDRGAGDERNRRAVDHGKALFAVIAVKRDLHRGVYLVVQMDGQADILLLIRRFVREAGGAQVFDLLPHPESEVLFPDVQSSTR